MKPRIIVLSGSVCSGKSTLAALICKKADAKLAKTKTMLAEISGKNITSRSVLQRTGTAIEKNSNGRWIAEHVSHLLYSDQNLGLVVIDSAHTKEQVQSLRNGLWSVTHVHLEASDDVLDTRSDYDSLSSHAKKVEIKSRRSISSSKELSSVADVVIQTDRCNADDVYARVIARLEQRPVISSPIIDILIGGQYGSEGKGNIAHYLAPEYDVLVRVGGPNAGHKVFRINNEPYTFRQLPSGALGNKDAALVIGAGAVISVETLTREISELSITYDKLIIDPNAMIINENDVAWEKAELAAAIGSTAQGIGKATARKIIGRKVGSDVLLAKDIPALRHYIRDTIDFFAECISGSRKIMLEGTQGTSLSLHHGHYPHVTSRATTAAACLAEAGLSARHVRKVVMVCRTYPIRVGDSHTGQTSGLMRSEITFEEISRRSGVPLQELVTTEVGSVSHRPRRVAEFDWAQLRRSLLLNGPTDLALTFADYLGVDNRKAYRYGQLTEETLRFIDELEKVSGISVSMISTAFNDRNIIDRRMW